MNRRIASVSLTLCAVILIGVASAQKIRTKTTQEPTTFNENDDPNPFWDSVPLPANVLDSLLATEEAKDRSDRLRGLDRKELAGLFSAVEVHPTGNQERDYLVLGKFPMSGGDCDWYWIVRSNQINPKVILFANTNSIEFLKERTNGYKDIRTLWYSAAGYSVICDYHYDGKKYRLVHQKIKTEKQTP